MGVATNGQNLGVLNLSLLDAGVGSTGGLGAGTAPPSAASDRATTTSPLRASTTTTRASPGRSPTFRPTRSATSPLLQNQFSPEFGHSTGGQFNITVIGGTNTSTALLYEYFQNRNLNAIDQAVANGPPWENPKTRA